MTRYLWAAALALVTVWATGCIIIDAEKVQSRRPATIRSDECVVHHSQASTPASELDSHAFGIIVEQ